MSRICMYNVKIVFYDRDRELEGETKTLVSFGHATHFGVEAQEQVE